MVKQAPGESTTATSRPTNGRRGLRLRGVIQIAIGLGALALVIWKSDARALIEAIRVTRVSLLPLAALASLTVTWLMAYRWGVILRVRGQKIKTARLFKYYLIGIFFMNFVPGGGVSGDVARLIYVDREVRDKPFVLSTLVYERLVGLFTLLLIGLGSMLAARASRPEGRLIYLVEAILAAAFVATTMLMSEAVSSRLARLSKSVAVKLGIERFGVAAARTLEAISDLRRHKRMILTTIILSVLIRVVWGFGCFIVAVAMGLPLSLPLVCAFISIVDLVRMLPVSIGGGLGVREWVLVALFANVGLTQEQAVMFSFLAFAPILLNAVAGGLIYVSRAGLVRTDRGVRDVAAGSAEA